MAPLVIRQNLITTAITVSGTGELGSAWEGGLRTVGMMRWPGKIKENWKSKEMFSEMDFFTTFAAITGAEVPTDRAIDGVDQTDFLLGKTRQFQQRFKNSLL